MSVFFIDVTRREPTLETFEDISDLFIYLFNNNITHVKLSCFDPKKNKILISYNFADS